MSKGFLARIFSRNGNRSENTLADRNGLCEVTEHRVLGIKAGESAFYDTLFPKQKKNEALSVPQKLVQDLVSLNLSQASSNPQVVPRLPSVIPRLIRSLRDPDTSASDYVNIIDKDPAMSAAVLKLANTVYFNPTDSKITSIERAVVTMGVKGLRKVLSAAVMQPVLKRNTEFFASAADTLWLHSLQVAIICEQLAIERRVDPYKAYMLGLVHDIGKITTFSELCRGYDQNAKLDDVGHLALVPIIKQQSITLSYQIANSWQLPQEICLGLKEQIKLYGGQKISTFGNILYEANLVGEALIAADHLPEKTLERLLLDIPSNALDASELRRLSGINI